MVNQTLGEHINRRLNNAVNMFVKDPVRALQADPEELGTGTPNPAIRGAQQGIAPGAGKIIGLSFLTSAIGSQVIGGITKEQLNQIVPLNELRITMIKDMYVNAPDEDTATRAFQALASTLAEQGIEGPQQRLFLEDANAERAQVLELQGQVPPGFQRRVGENRIQTAKRFEAEKIRSGEKAASEKETQEKETFQKKISIKELEGEFSRETGLSPTRENIREITFNRPEFSRFRQLAFLPELQPRNITEPIKPAIAGFTPAPIDPFTKQVIGPGGFTPAPISTTAPVDPVTGKPIPPKRRRK